MKDIKLLMTEDWEKVILWALFGIILIFIMFTLYKLGMADNEQEFARNQAPDTRSMLSDNAFAFLYDVSKPTGTPFKFSTFVGYAPRKVYVKPNNNNGTSNKNSNKNTTKNTTRPKPPEKVYKLISFKGTVNAADGKKSIGFFLVEDSKTKKSKSYSIGKNQFFEGMIVTEISSDEVTLKEVSTKRIIKIPIHKKRRIQAK
jgi:hypothetical protein